MPRSQTNQMVECLGFNIEIFLEPVVPGTIGVTLAVLGSKGASRIISGSDRMLGNREVYDVWLQSQIPVQENNFLLTSEPFYLLLNKNNLFFSSWIFFSSWTWFKLMVACLTGSISTYFTLIKASFSLRLHRFLLISLLLEYINWCLGLLQVLWSGEYMYLKVNPIVSHKKFALQLLTW